MAQAEARHYINAAHDAEVKRKRTTMEKAKASYLCSQLRIRLQYAKLKVDHGWQKQTLNEVENLYFRHSQTNRQHFNTVNTESTSSQQTNASTLSDGTTSASHSQSDAVGVVSAENAPLPHSADSRSQSSDSQMPSMTSPRRRNVTAKGKERDHSLPTPLFNGTPSTPTKLLSPSKRANRGARNHNTIVEDFPPATLADGGLQSSAKYLSSTYISSSPFPINVPMSGQDLPVSSSPFGSRDQALTYDSFWSSHSTWSSHLSLGGTTSPTRTTTHATATTPAGSQQS